MPSLRQSHISLVLVVAAPEGHPVLVLGIWSEAEEVAFVLPILDTHLGDSGARHGFFVLRVHVSVTCCQVSEGRDSRLALSWSRHD